MSSYDAWKLMTPEEFEESLRPRRRGRRDDPDFDDDRDEPEPAECDHTITGEEPQKAA